MRDDVGGFKTVFVGVGISLQTMVLVVGALPTLFAEYSLEIAAIELGASAKLFPNLYFELSRSQRMSFSGSVGFRKRPPMWALR